MVNTANTTLPALDSIDLTSNKITQMDWNIVSHIQKLFRVLLNENPIADINIAAPTSVTRLGLSKTFEVNGPFDITSYKHMHQLWLSHLKITGLTCLTSALPLQLTRLTIDGNPLGVLDLDYFNHIAPELKVLKARSSNITEVRYPYHFSSDFSFFCYLRVANCHIKFITYSFSAILGNYVHRDHSCINQTHDSGSEQQPTHIFTISVPSVSQSHARGFPAGSYRHTVVLWGVPHLDSHLPLPLGSGRW